eukprot:s21_g16.t1
MPRFEYQCNSRCIPDVCMITVKAPSVQHALAASTFFSAARSGASSTYIYIYVYNATFRRILIATVKRNQEAHTLVDTRRSPMVQ